MIPLEDNFNDVINKAIRGLAMDEAELARQSGVAWADITRIRSGQHIPGTLEPLARILGLHAPALEHLAQGKWRPQEQSLSEGYASWNTPYHDMFVNSYLLWDPRSKKAAAFDTGTDIDGMLETLEKHSLTLDTVFLTHAHNDHIMEIDRLVRKTRPREVLIGKREPVDGVKASVAENDQWTIGNLQVTALETWGHSPGGITYVVSHHVCGHPVAIVGDSLFAGSMGGGGVSYHEARQNNIRKILTLPTDTILCPGHGPLTTVGEELAHNPFFAT